MIEVSNLKKTYSNTIVLDVPYLNILPGESLGLVGNNGAGKTTLFRLILDLSEPTAGEVKIYEIAVKRNEAWKATTGSFLDESFLIDFLTPEEYFYFIGKLHQKGKNEVDEFLCEMDEFFNFEILEKKKLIRDFSKGNQKKIGICAALLGDPQILILDEPFTSLDPSSQIRLKKLLAIFQEKHNLTLLISSHDLNHITDVCQRIVVLEKGRIIKDLEKNNDTLSELEAYFAT
jgi:ABC-2 type transport system ATP-binding protein